MTPCRRARRPTGSLSVAGLIALLACGSPHAPPPLSHATTPTTSTVDAPSPETEHLREQLGALALSPACADEVQLVTTTVAELMSEQRRRVEQIGGPVADTLRCEPATGGRQVCTWSVAHDTVLCYPPDESECEPGESVTIVADLDARGVVVPGTLRCRGPFSPPDPPLR